MTDTPAVPTLESRLAIMKVEREAMDEFIKSQLKEGTDWDKSFKQANKPSLLKPGSEKVCLLLDLMPVFEVDHDILSKMPEAVKADNIVLRCKLVHRKTGETVADGRGSCSIKEKQGNVNTAIKIAEKRAQVDATLRVAALSDRFTQDVEDFPKEEGEEKPRTDKQANFIASLIRQKGLSPEESAEIVKKHGVEQGKLATITQAKAIIEEMLALPNAYEPTAAFAK